MRNSILAGVVGAALVLGLFGIPMAETGDTQKTFKWKMQTLFPKGSIDHEIIEQAVDELRKATNSRLDITVHPLGTFVGYRETLEALGQRIVDIAAIPTGFAGHLDPGFSLMFTLPGVWEGPQQVKLWFYEFGGEELLREAYAKRNVHLVDIIVKHAEGLMSKKRIQTLDDLQGLTVRTPPGLTSDVLQRVGARPVAMDGGEIYTALDTGVVDAAEFVSLATNYKMGLHEVTGYLLWPSFHSPITIDDVSVNMDAWEELPEDLQAAVQMFGSRVASRYTFATSGADYEALEKMKEHGLKHATLSNADQRKINAIGWELLGEWRKKSEFAEKIVTSVEAYFRVTGGPDE